MSHPMTPTEKHPTAKHPMPSFPNGAVAYINRLHPVPFGEPTVERMARVSPVPSTLESLTRISADPNGPIIIDYKDEDGQGYIQTWSHGEWSEPVQYGSSHRDRALNDTMTRFEKYRTESAQKKSK